MYTHLSLRDPIQMACFLRLIPRLGTYPWSPSCPYVVGGGGCCAGKANLSKLGGGVDSNGWVCSGVRKNSLVQEIYCAKPNLKPDSQSGSRVHKGLGTRALQSIRETNLAITIVIRTLTKTLTCEIGSSIFVSMSWLKVASTTCY